MFKKSRTSYSSSPSGIAQGESAYNQTMSRSFQPREPGSVRSGGVHPRGPSSVPSIGGNIPVQLTNSQISQPTNNTATIALLVRPWKNSDHRHFFSGDFIFCKRETSGVLQNVYDIEQLLKEPPKDKPKLIEHFKSINFLGIYRNESDINSHMSNKMNSQQALINVDVFGRTMVPNIFGKGTQSGDVVSLYFYCKEDVNEEFTYDIIPSNERQETPLKFENLLGIVPIGIVSFKGKNYDRIDTALKSRTKLSEVPQMEVLML